MICSRGDLTNLGLITEDLVQGRVGRELTFFQCIESVGCPHQDLFAGA